MPETKKVIAKLWGSNMKISNDGYPLGSKGLQYGAVLAVLLLTVIASFDYKGSQSLILLYGVLTALVVKTIFDNRHSFFGFFLFSFLTLGCWGKLVLHLLFQTNLIEPTGTFDNSGESWDSALIVLNIAFATLLVCNALVARIPQRRDKPLHTPSNSSLLLPLLYLSMIFTVAILVFNYKYSILKIGTTPTLQLGGYVYSFISFMIAWGNVILLATLAYWLINSGRLKPQALFYLISFEGALASVSMGSRAQMILHAAVPFIVYLTQGKRLGWTLDRTQWIKIILTSLALFVASILLVSADRINSFSQAKLATPAPASVEALATAPASASEETAAAPAAAVTATATATSIATPEIAPPVASVAIPAPAETLSTAPVATPATDSATTSVAIPPAAETPPPVAASLRWKWMFYELGRLVVDRWVGLEGVLTVTSSDANGPDLLSQALKESPAAGTEAIYQRMAGAQYLAFENFTFMTIPGPIAVLLYGGSYSVLIGGLALIFIICYLLELTTFYLLGNICSRAAIGIAMAYLVVQTNFPYVLLMLFIEALLFLGGLFAIRKILSIRPAGLA